VVVALEHPVLVAARRARRVWREAPVTTRDPDGGVTEGVIDLVHDDDDGFVVVDFKTDHELERHVDAYARQVAMYRDALSGILKKRGTCVLLAV
jgi:ATP-dependent exoDNAse (exonuclease V) beta subunit